MKIRKGLEHVFKRSYGTQRTLSQSRNDNIGVLLKVCNVFWTIFDTEPGFRDQIDTSKRFAHNDLI